jgi:hypothetical protein
MYEAGNHLLVCADYSDPEVPSHSAAHSMVSLDDYIDIITGSKKIRCRGILIPSGIAHTANTYKNQVLVFLFDSTTSISNQITEISALSDETVNEIIKAYYCFEKKSRLDDSKMTLSETQLEQLKERLSDGKPSILVMHVPVETDHNIKDMKILGNNFVIRKGRTDDNGREFIELCENPSVSIAAALCGHIHGYQKSQLIQGREQICCSSGMVGFVHRITVRGN